MNLKRFRLCKRGEDELADGTVIRSMRMSFTLLADRNITLFMKMNGFNNKERHECHQQQPCEYSSVFSLSFHPFTFQINAKLRIYFNYANFKADFL